MISLSDFQCNFQTIKLTYFRASGMTILFILSYGGGIPSYTFNLARALAPLLILWGIILHFQGININNIILALSKKIIKLAHFGRCIHTYKNVQVYNTFIHTAHRLSKLIATTNTNAPNQLQRKLFESWQKKSLFI